MRMYILSFPHFYAAALYSLVQIITHTLSTYLLRAKDYTRQWGYNSE